MDGTAIHTLVQVIDKKPSRFIGFDPYKQYGFWDPKWKWQNGHNKMNEFLKSPLFEKIKNELKKNENNKQIVLFVPYIKTKILEKLLEGINNQISIITTWHINDLISGSSELKLYQFCKEQNIALYIHNKIHLKVYSVNLESAIVASGNISHNGLMDGGMDVGF